VRLSFKGLRLYKLPLSDILPQQNIQDGRQAGCPFGVPPCRSACALRLTSLNGSAPMRDVDPPEEFIP
jgi:hypothetical protein